VNGQEGKRLEWVVNDPTIPPHIFQYVAIAVGISDKQFLVQLHYHSDDPITFPDPWHLIAVNAGYPPSGVSRRAGAAGERRGETEPAAARADGAGRGAGEELPARQTESGIEVKVPEVKVHEVLVFEA
jgi:hypothetical protein